MDTGILSKQKNILTSKYNILIIGSIVFTFLIWFYIQMFGSVGGNVNKLFAFLLGVAPFLASFKGYLISRSWGLNSVIGKAIFALSLGLLLWSIGEFIWAYYFIRNIENVPYPSWADLGYATGVSFWIISAIYMAKLTAVTLLLKSKPVLRYFSFLVVIASLVLSYHLLVNVARDGVLVAEGGEHLKAFFDFWYPLTDVFSITTIALVMVVSGKYLGGILKKPIFLVFLGLIGSYLFDLSFSFTTTNETYFNGHPNDLLLLMATGCLSIAVLYFSKPELKGMARNKIESRVGE